MIVANYTAHFYCDCEACEEASNLEQAEYIGESWAQVSREARKDGWRISADRTRSFAPGHKVKRNSPSKAK